MTKTVLVAIHDEPIRDLIHLTLGDRAWRVVESADDESTMRMIASTLPDVLLIDADLPESGGIRFANSVKAQPETAGARIVLLHDKIEPVDHDAARAAGVDDFLAKPFTAFALLKKVKSQLEDG